MYAMASEIIAVWHRAFISEKQPTHSYDAPPRGGAALWNLHDAFVIQPGFKSGKTVADLHDDIAIRS
jgi:hypothetical protein